MGTESIDELSGFTLIKDVESRTFLSSIITLSSCRIIWLEEVFVIVKGRVKEYRFLPIFCGQEI